MSFAFNRRPLSAALAAIGLAMPLPDAFAPRAADAALRDVVVTATRTAQAAGDIPGTVTAIGREEIERRPVNDIADLFRDEPDVSISSNTVRFGTGAINIRGIEDNRVMLLIDGVRAADYRDAGSTNYTASVRDLPEPEFLKRVEIVRGPGSSLYGSDAIGGVVGFVTLDPEDLLKSGSPSASGVKLDYFGENAGIKGTAWHAAAGDSLKGMIMLSRQDNKETENKGDRNVFGTSRTTPNPLDSTATSVLAKLVWAPAAGHELRATFEAREKQTDTDVQRIANYNPKSPTALTRITVNTGDDSLRRHRLSLDYTHTPGAGWYDQIAAKAYWQRQDSENLNYQRRSNASLNATWGCSSQTAGAGNCDVNQRFEFAQSVLGASVVMEKALTGAVTHSLTWGADLLRTTTQEKKNTTWTNLATGVSSNKFIGETYPLSEYPEGDFDQLGVFGQDEIRILDGRLRLTPGLRHDQFRLRPNANDSLYHPVAGKTAVAKSGSRVSPKLSVAYDLHRHLQVYGQYVEGFKAPTYEQVNRYFSNNQVLYGLVGNPDLKPESSKGIEFGLRAGDASLGGQLSLFRNRYEDFIESVALANTDPNFIAGFNSTYQYKNLSNVRIHGHELRGHWKARQDLRLSAAYAYAWGEYESTPGMKLPLNSVEPRRLTLTALWSPGPAWGAEARLRASARQNRVDDTAALASYNTPVFRAPGYAVVDLGGWWQMQRGVRLTASVGNLFDRKYWLWSTARTMNAGDRGPEFHTQPGRSLSVGVRFDI